MRLLLDNNLSPKLLPLLSNEGHDVTHVREHGLADADDATILAFALETHRVLISADSDFGALLASMRTTEPSFVLIRRIVGRRATELATVLLDNLPTVQEDLDAGAVVVLGDNSLRVRRLPIP